MVPVTHFALSVSKRDLPRSCGFLSVNKRFSVPCPLKKSVTNRTKCVTSTGTLKASHKIVSFQAALSVPVAVTHISGIQVPCPHSVSVACSYVLPEACFSPRLVCVAVLGLLALCIGRLVPALAAFSVPVDVTHGRSSVSGSGQTGRGTLVRDWSNTMRSTLTSVHTT